MKTIRRWKLTTTAVQSTSPPEGSPAGLQGNGGGMVEGKAVKDEMKRQRCCRGQGAAASSCSSSSGTTGVQVSGISASTSG